MARNRLRFGVLWVFVWLALPAVATAQSAITGIVRDTSGGAMPGVTVEASSPVLIEKVKTTISEGNGSYRITDLRPGTYTVTFTLPGFSAYIREGFELTTDFTATLNAELKVGALEESITVTGASPVVDVASAARVTTLDRETLDTLPTGRSIFSMGQLVPGVNLNQPDVGGSRAMQQTYMSTRGLTSANNIVQVDGMMINGLDGDGAVQQYINNAFVQEMTYQTAGAGSDVSPGGVRVNIVAKDGGNRFSG
ncbi:MAG: carboxypeptidase regulatory-like domain-containing protein, partial [Vicinamibacterales bacterium]